MSRVLCVLASGKSRRSAKAAVLPQRLCQIGVGADEGEQAFCARTDGQCYVAVGNVRFTHATGGVSEGMEHSISPISDWTVRDNLFAHIATLKRLEPFTV